MAKKKLTADQQSKVDKLAKARDLYGKKSREGLQVQNQINKLMGVNKVHDYSNAPTAKQMRIAGKMKDKVVAEHKVRSSKTGQAIAKAGKEVMGRAEGSKKAVKTAMAGTLKKKKKTTRYAGD